MSHTPGPWETGDIRHEDHYSAIPIRTKGYPRIGIASVSLNLESRLEQELRDNAQVLAAAPDLLAALQALLDSDYEIAAPYYEMEQAQKAIAAATGGGT